MITIEYKEYGNAYTDFQAEEMARSICHVFQETKESKTYVVGNDILVDTMKLMVLEGNISHNDLQFKFKDDILKVNHLGEIERYPIGFCDIHQNILFRLLKGKKKNLNV